MSLFWMAVWGVGIYFVLQRWVTLYVLCRYYGVKPIPPAEIPSLSATLRQGWKALLVPIIIFVPLFLDFKFGATFFTERLGKAGAKAFSDSVILFTPGLAAAYTIFISRRSIPGGPGIVNMYNMFKDAVKGIVPVSATIYFAYSISYLFGGMKVGPAMGKFIQSLGMNFWELALFIPIFFAFLGMILPGSSQIAIFGTGVVGAMAAMGVNPVLATSVLPALTSALEGMTPPLALCMFTAMGIAGSGFLETSRLTFVWVIAHSLVAVLLLVGFLPAFFI